ncbi:MAG: 3-dehydroquinate synthase [Candidatus Lernaella stagnicola]|nr:3-dehydroquinate synthase [Candidatus Lernaella stagnicola]
MSARAPIWSITTTQHPIRIGRGMRETIAEFLPPWIAAIGVVADETVAELHAATLLDLLPKEIPRHLFVFPPGDENKSREIKARLEDEMVAAGLGRDGLLIALGGGVTLDLTGYIAATYMRGIPWLAMPTTLLGAVDAAIGGKTGVNTSGGKNMVGAFHAPLAVLVDLDFLATLPRVEMQNGLAEMVKHAVVADRMHLDELVALGRLDEGRDLDALGRAIHRSAQIKARITEADPREGNLRQTLNLGHTFAHAIEKVTHFGTPHGLAVAIGVAAACRLATKLGRLSDRERDTVLLALRGLDLPTELPPGCTPEAIWDATATDKKSRGGHVRFVLPATIGSIVRDDTGNYGYLVERDAVLSVLRDMKEGGDDPH